MKVSLNQGRKNRNAQISVFQPALCLSRPARSWRSRESCDWPYLRQCPLSYSGIRISHKANFLQSLALEQSPIKLKMWSLGSNPMMMCKSQITIKGFGPRLVLCLTLFMFRSNFNWNIYLSVSRAVPRGEHLNLTKVYGVSFSWRGPPRHYRGPHKVRSGAS